MRASCQSQYNYHYDQLNRIVAMDAYQGLNDQNGTFTPVSISAYQERVSYDPNGNILKYNRHGDAARISMDSLTYTYKPKTNQLDEVADAASDASPTDYPKYNDIKQGQSAGNYQYDAIGNLVSDVSEGITNITWNVYGKIASLTKSGQTISYTYDASGNRTMKATSSLTTAYVRDASGNVMSVYTQPTSGALVQSEMDIYGSSKLGMATQHLNPDTAQALSALEFDSLRKSMFTRGEKLFELSNHLGNVLVTIDDRRIQKDSNADGNVDTYAANISSANDYYPFGMSMPSRNYTASSSYRYGFNGKENDNEVKGAGNQQDYGMRIYDPRSGRFLSTDPLIKSYPWYSPYQFAGNSPIQSIDVDGLEPASVSLLRSISSMSSRIVAGSSSGNYNATTYTVSIANGIAVDPAGNVLVFTSVGGLANTLDFSHGGASSDIALNAAFGFSLYNKKASSLISLLGQSKTVGVGVGFDKFGVGPGVSVSAEMSTNNELVGGTVQISFGMGAGTPLVLSGQRNNATGVIFAKSEYDKVYNMEKSITKGLQSEIDNYNLLQATNSNGTINYAKAQWQADGGTVNVGYQQIGDEKYEILINTTFRQYAQQTNVPGGSPSDSYKDNVVHKTYRTGVILKRNDDGNYISEKYNN